MKINIEIKKRQMYFIIFLIVLGFTILFVQGQGVSNFGHSSDQVNVDIGGQAYTLQDAINGGLITNSGSESDIINVKTLEVSSDINTIQNIHGTNCAWTDWSDNGNAMNCADGTYAKGIKCDNNGAGSTDADRCKINCCSL